MDYKIKFEYKGIGKQAATARKQAVQASQRAVDKKSGTTPGINRELINSIQRLIDSNKNLEKSIKDMVSVSKAGLGGGGGKKTTGGVFGGGSGSGLSGVGRSIPIAGIPIAIAGFAIQKINQIGNSFIQLAGQQAKTVGYGKFQRGAGMYGSAEMGAGIAAYVKSAGAQMGTEVDKGESKKIRDIGALYGLSAEEVYGQAGTFKRAGGSYTRAAAQAVGGGIGSELPVLLQGMSGMLEDAIRNGLDASDMADNLSKGLTDLTNVTPGRSAHAAMQMVQNFQSVKQSVAEGKFGSMEALYAGQVSRNLLMQNLQNPNYVEKLQKQGLISEKQAGKISKMGKTDDYNKLMESISPLGAQTLLQHTAATTDPTTLMRGIIEQAQQTYGKDAEGFQRFQAIASQMGFSQKMPQIRAQWNLAAGRGTTEDVATMEKLGVKKITKGAERVQASEAGMAITQQLGRESLQLGTIAQNFAKTSLALEQTIQGLVKSIEPTPAQINSFKETLSSAGSALSGFKDSLDSAADSLNKKVTGFFE